MPPSKKDILLTYYGKKRSQRKILQESNDNLIFKATIENYSYKAGKWIITLIILSLIMLLITGIGSLIIPLFALTIIIIYYYGIKRSIQKKLTNKTKYYCIYCNHVFVGPKHYCENCGSQLECDRNMYKCNKCGETFIGKRKNCPHCKTELYY